MAHNVAHNSSASLRRLRESAHCSSASMGKHKMVGFRVSTPEQIVNAKRYWGRLRGRLSISHWNPGKEEDAWERGDWEPRHEGRCGVRTERALEKG